MTTFPFFFFILLSSLHLLHHRRLQRLWHVTISSHFVKPTGDHTWKPRLSLRPFTIPNPTESSLSCPLTPSSHHLEFNHYPINHLWNSLSYLLFISSEQERRNIDGMFLDFLLNWTMYILLFCLLGDFFFNIYILFFMNCLNLVDNHI